MNNLLKEKKNVARNLHDVKGKILECSIVVSEFDSHSHNHVPFWKSRNLHMIPVSY